MLRGRVLLDGLHRPEAARDLLAGVTRRFPRSAEAWYYLGRAHAARLKADDSLAAFKQAVARQASPVRVLGPAECPVFKLNNFYRFHFQLQSENSGRLHEVLREVLAVAKPPHAVEFQVDVDPYNML